MTEGTVLIVDDARADVRLYQAFLEAAGIDAGACHDGRTALSALERRLPQVLLLDLHLPDMTGIDILKNLEQYPHQCHVIVITADDEVRTAVSAMQAGAFDYLTKPISRDRLIVTVRNALNHSRLSHLVSRLAGDTERDQYHGMVGAAPSMQVVYQTIESAAQSKAAVFITGESGTGKELCARALHMAGNRQQHPFVAINCAALPSDLLESELFGHVKGAFTGANQNREGAAQRAHGGSLFLDEITELDIELQAKLLRFLQTQEVQSLGSNQVQRVDVRVICASNRDPWQAVRDGRLREDLYYRLMVIPIELPPLRERQEDIVDLAYHFLGDLAAEESKQFNTIADDACAMLKAYHWPGNVRQLENLLRRVVVLHEGSTITANMIPAMLQGPPQSLTRHSTAPKSQHNGDAQREWLPPVQTAAVRPLRDVERDAIESAIAHCEGNISRAAKLLGINASTIHRKRKHWLQDNDERIRPDYCEGSGL